LVIKFQGVDGGYYDDVEKARYAKPASGNGGGGLRTPSASSGGGASPSDITASINPQTKERMYVVPGLRQRFATYEEAQAAAGRLGGGSNMSQSLSRYGD
jgi:hypothetical protein